MERGQSIDSKQYVLDEEARKYLHLRMVANIKVASLPQESDTEEKDTIGPKTKLEYLQYVCTQPTDYSPRLDQVPFRFEQPILSLEQSASLHECWLNTPLPVITGNEGDVIHFKFAESIGKRGYSHGELGPEEKTI